MNLEPTYSTAQVAALLDMSTRWVQQMAHRDDIGYIEGNGRRYLAADLGTLRALVNEDEKRGRPRG